MKITNKNFEVSFSFRGLALLSILSAATLAFAAEATTADSIDEFQLAMKLFGGLALFLFGIDQMSDGLKAVAGNRMATLLGGMTRNRFLGGITPHQPDHFRAPGRVAGSPDLLDGIDLPDTGLPQG